MMWFSSLQTWSLEQMDLMNWMCRSIVLQETDLSVKIAEILLVLQTNRNGVFIKIVSWFWRIDSSTLRSNPDTLSFRVIHLREIAWICILQMIGVSWSTIKMRGLCWVSEGLTLSIVLQHLSYDASFDNVRKSDRIRLFDFYTFFF